jgi:hypothetical protein
MIAWLLACGQGPDDTDALLPPRTGAGMNVRHLDGTPMLDATARYFPSAGGEAIHADVDAAGFALFLESEAGAYGAEAAAEFHTTAYGQVEVVPDHVGAFQFWLGALEAAAIPDPLVGGTLDFGASGTVSWPGGAFSVNGETYDGTVPLEHLALGPAEALLLPGSVQRLRSDGVVEPLVFHYAVHVRFPTTDAGPVAMDFPGIWRIPVPFGSPADVADELATYVYNVDSGFWNKAADASVVDGVVTGEMTRFGWWAVGSPAVNGACVRGTVLDVDDAPLFGAEVLAVQEEVVGVRRSNVDPDGLFCLPTEPGTGGQVHILAFSASTDVVYKDAPYFAAPVGPADCGMPETCLNLGELRPISHADDDGDGYYAGVGDCDDDDAAVNPTVLMGDGSACFDD